MGRWRTGWLEDQAACSERATHDGDHGKSAVIRGQLRASEIARKAKRPPCVSAGGRRSKPGERLGGQGRGRTADLPIFSRTLVPTELPGPAAPWCTRTRRLAVLTGLEPATSALTGRRALQLLHRTLLCNCAWFPSNFRCQVTSAPNGIRTRATALKGRRPGPLDDEGNSASIARLQHIAA